MTPEPAHTPHCPSGGTAWREPGGGPRISLFLLSVLRGSGRGGSAGWSSSAAGHRGGSSALKAADGHLGAEAGALSAVVKGRELEPVHSDP